MSYATRYFFYGRNSRGRESLNPIDYAIKISNIPQLHVSGGKDTILPSSIMYGYVKVSSSDCIQQKILDDEKNVGPCQESNYSRPAHS
jgi:hypothetical protein